MGKASPGMAGAQRSCLGLRERRARSSVEVGGFGCVGVSAQCTHGHMPGQSEPHGGLCTSVRYLVCVSFYAGSPVKGTAAVVGLRSVVGFSRGGPYPRPPCQLTPQMSPPPWVPSEHSSQGSTNNGLGFQVPACVQMRVSVWLASCLSSSQAVYIYSAVLVPSAALSDPLGIRYKQTLALGSFSVI